MRYSRTLIPTLREDPAEAEVVSHRLMLRSGFLRKSSAGVYSILPLGQRVLHKLETIVREEMNRAGAQEVLLPAMNPAELWRESGRWDHYGRELIRLKDRHDRDFCLGPTHEEVVTDLIRREVRSYRELPLNLYQIQTKFRDEIRPRFGLMRGREFIMKDAYSFDTDEEAADESYRLMYEAYHRIFDRCGLRYKVVEADTGPIGGHFSHEFMVMADTGEDAVVFCSRCDYATNAQRAEGRPAILAAGRNTPRPLERVRTEGVTTVEELVAYLGVVPQQVVKTLLYQSDGETVAVLVRGDHRVNETKLKNRLGAADLNLADAAVIERITGGPEGYSGPVGLERVRLLADLVVAEMSNFAVGANQADAHLVNVNIPRDFSPPEMADLRQVEEGDLCPRCGAPLCVERGIEVGHVFKLGTKYSEALRATYQDATGKERFVYMGCYGIGIGRTAAAAIEQNHDADGIIWPVPLAPFEVVLLPVNTKEEKLRRASEEIYDALGKRGVEVLLDDRDERPGVKFKDADLLGIPFQAVLGARNLDRGLVEVKVRATGESVLVEIEKVVGHLADRAALR